MAATFAWSEVELVAGLDALRSEHRARASRYRMPMMGQSAQYTDADQFPWTKDSVMHNYGAFAELTWQAAS